MERIYSNIIQTPVYDDGIRPLTSVKDVLVDPETGKIIALIVNPNENLVIIPIDIVSWKGAINIHHADHIINADEVLRVTEVQKMNIPIFHNNVETKSGKRLGKVVDFSVDADDLVLRKLYVAKEFLGLVRFENRIIPAKNIIEILEGKIVVQDDLAAIKEEERKMAVEDMTASV